MAHDRILVADLNARFLEKTGEILAEREIELLAVSDGQGALPLCRAKRPDAALLNVDLGDVAGNDICRRLKLEDPCLPVTLMYPEEHEDLEEEMRHCRADNYLVRPIRRKELLYCVRSMLQLRRLFEDRQAVAALSGEALDGELAFVGLQLFHRFLELEVRRADRYGFPLAVLSIGIDRLPSDIPNAWLASLEKQLGQALAAAIRTCVRDIDLSTALSMQEMLVTMPHTDGKGAAVVAERIRATIESQPYHFGRTRIQPTVSIGVGTVHGDRLPAAQLVSAAQSRRLQAAHAGGNRVFT